MNSGFTEKLVAQLTKPVDNSTLILFRILFGLLMFVELCRYFSIAAYQYHSGFHFTYPLLGFIGPPASDPDLNAAIVEFLFLIMLASTFCIAIGLLYRIAIVVFCIVYSYFFFIDLTFYNNHFYLISLLALLMSFAQLNSGFSIDAWWKKQSANAVPFWQLAIFRAQWVIVYFYAGLAKIQSDWLSGEPVRGIFLGRNENVASVVDLVGLENLTMIVAWGGMIFDLSIAFLLMFKRTRFIGLPAFFIFHVSNHFIFDIGIFPWLALASVVLFLDPATARKFLNWISGKQANETENKLETLTKPVLKPAVAMFLAIYFAIQIALPLRHYFYPQRSGWTQQGYKFAWRMMLNYWDAWLRVTVVDRETGNSYEWNRHDGITQIQLNRMKYQPRALAQYARHIRNEARKMGVPDPVVRMEVVASLNGRPYQFLVNPTIDAASLTWQEIETGDWIVPLEDSDQIGNYAEDEADRLKRISTAKFPIVTHDNSNPEQ